MIRLVLLWLAMLMSACENADKSLPSSIPDSFHLSVLNPIHAKDSSLIDSAALGIVFKPSVDYMLSRRKIEKNRMDFNSRYTQLSIPNEKNALLDSAGQFLTAELINSIIPHWYGMAWDFNGYSETPGKGAIACGYFVSNTLKHAGFKINRFKMAQQAGYYEALTLQDDSLLIILDNQYNEANKTICKKLKTQLNDGLYFIGLNCHVGYLFVKNNELFFIHSNYVTGRVMIEKAEFSQAFTSSIYILADITHNSVLVEKWILGNEIVVITSN